jgi:hypothetical protein
MNSPIDGKPAPHLSPWHKRQAAMLYHFSSLDYLKGLHRMVSNAVAGEVEPLLMLAKAQGRDTVLTDARWGTRNTAENWANNAWPFLKDLQTSLAKDISNRALERYQKTAVNECFRGLREYSMQWATADEEQRFEEILETISAYSNEIDTTLDDYYGVSGWTDSAFTRGFAEFRAEHHSLPCFRVRTDVTAESGKTPSRTGVYIAQDDPNAALQFAWIGNGGGKLRAASTFSEIGLAALQAVGRKDLWLNDQKMFEFATSGKYDDLFRPTIYMLGQEHLDFAWMAVSKEAFIDRPCKWYFVETVNGEFESLDDDTVSLPTAEFADRIIGGQTCKRTGFYFTPAQPGSRQRFVQGTKVPDYKTQYGQTIWQWDPLQD